MDVLHRMIVDDLKKAMEKDKKQNEVEFVSLDEQSVFLHSACSLIALSKIAPKMKRLIRYPCKSGRNGDAKKWNLHFEHSLLARDSKWIVEFIIQTVSFRIEIRREMQTTRVELLHRKIPRCNSSRDNENRTLSLFFFFTFFYSHNTLWLHTVSCVCLTNLIINYFPFAWQIDYHLNRHYWKYSSRDLW